MKRAADGIMAFAMIVILVPVFIVVFIVVRLALGSPAIFKQARPGYLGKPFELFKFRTMTNALDEQGSLLPDDKRMTRFGGFLRSTSLDELPELFNVLKGDMSMVGPRPLLMEYLDRYTPAQARRHEVLPGITGWAQVNGRNAISWEKKFEFDVWYVDHRSFLLDIHILWLTVVGVLARRNIAHEGCATMDKYLGTEEKTR